MKLRVVAVALLLATAACREPADAERTGDRAYAAGDFAAARRAYAEAAGAGAGADVLAKLGLASLRAGDAAGALDAYRRLAAEGPAGEAGEGIAAAARVAAGRGDGETLRSAVTALRTVAPELVEGRWVLELARRRLLSGDDLVSLAPQAVAAAPDSDAGDSVLIAWADALVRQADCPGAGSLYRAVARRSRTEGLAEPARAGAAACALAAANRALAARDTGAALDALGSVEAWADADSGAAVAAALAEEIRAAAAAEQLPPMDTTFFMEELDDR